jgi:hypothetical protein
MRKIPEQLRDLAKTAEVASVKRLIVVTGILVVAVIAAVIAIIAFAAHAHAAPKQHRVIQSAPVHAPAGQSVGQGVSVTLTIK